MIANIMSKNKVYLSLADKQKIVGEAYTQLNQIKATACQYRMQPTQICCWWATIHSAGLEANGAVVGTSKKNKTLHKGKDTVITQQQWTHLFDYFEWLHAEGHIVSVWILAIELCHLDATYIGEPQSMLDQRIRRFLGKNNIDSHRITWIAQNTRYNQVVIDDWVSLVNNSIIASKYSPSCIVNIDETNICFDITQAMTLEVQGQHTVSIQNIASTQHCIGVSMDGCKLLP